MIDRLLCIWIGCVHSVMVEDNILLYYNRILCIWICIHSVLVGLFIFELLAHNSSKKYSLNSYFTKRAPYTSSKFCPLTFCVTKPLGPIKSLSLIL